MAVIKLSNSKKRQLIALTDQAMALAGQGQLEMAQRICSKADSLYKDFPDTLYARGLIAFHQRDVSSATQWFSRACTAAPKRVEFLVNYAGCLRMQGREEKASGFYRQALLRSPCLAEAAFGYGSTLAAMGEYRQAIQVFKKALVSEPRNVNLLKKLAIIQNELAENEMSLSLLEKAHTIAPNDVSILYDMGTYLVQLGEIEAARTHFREALQIKPQYVEALNMLINSGSYGEREADVAAMQVIYDQAETGSEQRIVAAFALGTDADRVGQFELAFAYWAEGNSQRKQRLAYDESEQEALHQAAAVAFPASRFSEANVDASKAAPVFIVGMPRSGSTLLEQALSRHPALQACGEMYAMQQSIVGRKRTASNIAVIEKLTSMGDEELLAIGREYARRLIEEYRLEGRVIDKALNNYLYVGLIAKALPQARIIHIRREPMASCLSMFEQDFVNTLPYAFELGEMGRLYARYQKLMQHWRDVLPAGIMLEVRYEDLVSNPEGELRRLLEGCNLGWHEDCLNAHEAKGVVSTSSRFQVRKPMHQKSVARWKQYEKQLAPLKKCL